MDAVPAGGDAAAEPAVAPVGPLATRTLDAPSTAVAGDVTPPAAETDAPVAEVDGRAASAAAGAEETGAADAEDAAAAGSAGFAFAPSGLLDPAGTATATAPSMPPPPPLGGLMSRATVRDSTTPQSAAVAVRAPAARPARVPPAPGCSHMDWMKLCRSGADFTAGRARGPVTLAELGLHASPDDAWMALRGKVYNITPYLRFHPGGEAQLMRGAGRDGTALFNQHHAWVNAEFMLERALIGTLETEPTAGKAPAAAL